MGGDEGAGDTEESKVQEVVQREQMEDEDDLLGLPQENQSVEDFDMNLPETVTLLHGPNGSKLYLIGTAHFSCESINDVSRVIRTVKPHIVVVELCKSRANILKMDEKTIEEEARNLSFEKMVAIVKENGVLQGIMHILLLNLSAQLTRDLGMAPGGEFRRAFTESLKVKRSPHCVFHFGDRSIQITLKRALAVLSWWQRLRFAMSLLFMKPKVSREDVEKFKRSDLLEPMLNDLAADYPELGKVFIEERDMYLTYSLQLATSSRFSAEQDEPTVAVGVVGIGHTPGIKSNWMKITEDDIRPIMVSRDIKGPGVVRKVIIFGIITYLGMKIVRRLPALMAV